MKITIKTLQNKQLPVEIDDNATVRQLKEKIEELHTFQADLQKLIAYGKVLEDETKTLVEYSIKDGDFLVIMIVKAKPPPKAAESVPSAPAQPSDPVSAPAQSVPA